MSIFLARLVAPFKWIWVIINCLVYFVLTIVFILLTAFLYLLFGKRVPYIEEVDAPDIKRWLKWLCIEGTKLLPAHAIAVIIFVGSYLFPHEVILALRWTGFILVVYIALIIPASFYCTWVQEQRWFPLADYDDR